MNCYCGVFDDHGQVSAVWSQQRASYQSTVAIEITDDVIFISVFMIDFVKRIFVGNINSGAQTSRWWGAMLARLLILLLL